MDSMGLVSLAGHGPLGVVPVLAHLKWESFRPWNFVLESIEIGGFTAFWIMQTFELWDLGVDPVPVRYLRPGTKAHPKPELPPG